MTLKPEILILIVVLSLLIGAGSSYYFSPTKVVTKFVTQVQIKDVIHTNVVTVTKTIKQPNGAVETDTTKTDLSITNDQSQTVAESDKSVTRKESDWKASVQFSSSSTLPEYLYGASIDRKLLGPIYIGAFGNASRVFGAEVGISF
jgi:hypothetical protein